MQLQFFILSFEVEDHQFHSAGTTTKITEFYAITCFSRQAIHTEISNFLLRSYTYLCDQTHIAL